LALARENAELLGFDIELREGGIDAAAEGWDLVVSNPPYVESLDGLQAELRFEPAVALIGAGFHEEIARTASTRLLVLEIGAGQGAEVAAALEAESYRDVAITPDLAGLDRVVEGRR
jgi:methylase of polypeptide subunit release factors